MPKLNDIENVFFDLDGTLADSKGGVTTSISFALEQLGENPVHHRDIIEGAVGPPLRETFGKILKRSDAIDEALSVYRRHYNLHGVIAARLFPGVEDLLAALSGRDKRMFIATSKVDFIAENLIEHLSLKNKFVRVFASAPDGTHSNKVHLLKWAIKQENILPKNSVMIGDRSHDVLGGSENGMATVGVLYGYGTRRELSNSGADCLCESPSDVIDLLVET